MPPSCCDTTADHFDDEFVRDELDAYRRGKLQATSRMLIDELSDDARTSARMLDIGGGIGVVSHALLAGSKMNATLVEISTAFLDVARVEAAARGLDDRMTFIHGDATELETESADIVVLDRVVCCYEDWQRLISETTAMCSRTYALSYPRDIWLGRIVTGFKNWRRRRAGNDFRTIIHSEKSMDGAIQQAGFTRVARRGNIAWRIAVYRRAAFVS